MKSQRHCIEIRDATAPPEDPDGVVIAVAAQRYLVSWFGVVGSSSDRPGLSASGSPAR